MKESEETLFSPNSTECEAVKAVEEELEDAVARYAKDNLLVVRVRKNSLLDEDFLVLSVWCRRSRTCTIRHWFLESGFPEGPVLPEDDQGPDDDKKRFLWISRWAAFPHCVFSYVAFPHCTVSFHICDFSYLWLFPTVPFHIWLFPTVTFHICDFSPLSCNVLSQVVGSDSVAAFLSSRCLRSDITSYFSSLQSARGGKCLMSSMSDKFLGSRLCAVAFPVGFWSSVYVSLYVCIESLLAPQSGALTAEVTTKSPKKV